MKNQILLSILALTIFSIGASAKVWTVNNYHGAADFTTLQSAINGAANGDTLYLEPSTSDYGAGTLNKRLTIIGPGYWLEESDSTQANKNVARVTQLVFNAGSQGSQVSGLYIDYGNFGSQQYWKLLTINADSITIDRNFLKGYANAGTTFEGYTFYINGNRSGILIQQNWIEAAIYDDQSYNYNGTVNCIYYSGIPSDCIIQNNFIRGYLIGGSCGYRAIYLPSNNSQNDVRILNNVIWGPIITYYTELTNNIMVSGSYNVGLGDGAYHNSCNTTQFPNENGNQQNVVMDSVFVDYLLYKDFGYLLKPNSPARNAGVNGGDCGVFSNETGPSYILSGIPPIPAIFEVNTENYGEETIPVNIKAKSNN